MVSSYRAATDVDVLTANVPIARLGLMPVIAFVIKAPEPVLVHTGTCATGFNDKRFGVLFTSDCKMILSSHLPAANRNMTERLLSSFVAAPTAQPWSDLVRRDSSRR